MFLNILELVVLALFVIGRIVGTCVIVWLCCQYVDEGRFWLILITVIVGLGFSYKYHNPNCNNPNCLDESHRQPKINAPEVSKKLTMQTKQS